MMMITVTTVRKMAGALPGTSGRHGQRRVSGRAVRRRRPKSCTPELTKVNIHWTTPRRLSTTIHWISDNPSENATEHVKAYRKMPLKIHNGFRGVDFWRANLVYPRVIIITRRCTR